MTSSNTLLGSGGPSRHSVGTEVDLLTMEKPAALRFIGGGLFFFCTLAGMIGAASGYHVIKKIPIPGDYGWEFDRRQRGPPAICFA